MLKYLVILLDDTSASYCHCDNPNKNPRLIPLDTLNEAILYAMKENLMIQFVWPDYELPQEYKDVIATIDHVNIVPSQLTEDADVVVYDGIPSEVTVDSTVVIRLTLDELLGGGDRLGELTKSVSRLNVAVRDTEHFSDATAEQYQSVLDNIATIVKDEYVGGHAVQVNMLTDRLMLSAMNNCNAGWESLTLAPDGHFYICPAFYYSGDSPVGSVADGIDIKNPQLYRLDHAPICRNCDAWHCRRCVWLNQRTTLEVNTPSHEQCVMAHTEREASRRLLDSIRKNGSFMPEMDIPEIEYNDPFEKIKQQLK